MSPTIPARKAALRAIALQRRAAVSATQAAQFAERLAHVGVEMARDAGGERVALYSPLRGEPDCMPLLAALGAAGCRTLLPAIVRRSASPLAFRSYRIGDPLGRGSFGSIPEPPPTQAAEDPDVLFIPCVAFDRSGGRIGFGGGYYDATIADLRTRVRIRAIAVAFACQEIDAVPRELHDEALDFVVTEREIVVCSKVGKGIDAASVHR